MQILTELNREMDDLRYDTPKKQWDLSVPVATRLDMLKDWNRKCWQLQEIQDHCEHKEFEDGYCKECRWKCDHDDIEENHCLFCGEFVEPYDFRMEPEYREDR